MIFGRYAVRVARNARKATMKARLADNETVPDVANRQVAGILRPPQWPHQNA